MLTATLTASLISGCTSDGPAERGSTADAYALVLQWFVDRSESEVDPPLVFVEALGEGVSIGLDTQAAVLSSTVDFAEVRFIDDRSEALSDGVVRDGGILIALGPIVWTPSTRVSYVPGREPQARTSPVTACSRISPDVVTIDAP